MYIKYNYKLADEGARQLSGIIKSQFLAMTASIDRASFAAGYSHNKRNGIPIWYSKPQVERINTALENIGSILLKTFIDSETRSIHEQPYSYGETYADKFAVLRNSVNLVYIFQKKLGWSAPKQNSRFSESSSMYNKFKAHELEEINKVIREIGEELLSIRLIWQNPETGEADMSEWFKDKELPEWFVPTAEKPYPTIEEMNEHEVEIELGEEPYKMSDLFRNNERAVAVQEMGEWRQKMFGVPGTYDENMPKVFGLIEVNGVSRRITSAADLLALAVEVQEMGRERHGNNKVLIPV